MLLRAVGPFSQTIIFTMAVASRGETRIRIATKFRRSILTRGTGYSESIHLLPLRLHACDCDLEK